MNQSELTILNSIFPLQGSPTPFPLAEDVPFNRVIEQGDIEGNKLIFLFSPRDPSQPMTVEKFHLDYRLAIPQCEVEYL